METTVETVKLIVESLAEITEYEIATPAAYQVAGDDLKIVKRHAREIEGPLSQQVQAARDFFRPAEEILAEDIVAAGSK